MESNDAFEAEVEIEVLNRSTSHSNKTKKGPDAFTAAYGSIDTPKAGQGEEEPLLGYSGNSDTNDGDDSRGGAPIWTGYKDFEGRPWWRKPSIWWLLPVFILFTMSFGGTIVIKINIILSLICRNYLDGRAMKDRTFQSLPVLVGSENPQCQIPEVQALVSKFTLYGSLISGILSAFTSPKLGAMSDRYGRTRMMALSTGCMLISEALFILVATYPEMISINLLLVGYLFDGLGGSFIAVMAISYAFASDCTPPEKRNVVFGYYQGCLFGGMALGPLFSGYIVKATGSLLSIFYIALGCHLLFFLHLLLVVPESLTKERQLAARKKVEPAGSVEDHGSGLSSQARRALKSTNLFAPLAIFWNVEPGADPAVRRNLLFIAAVDTTMFGVAMGAMTVILIYSEFMFGWGNFETNVYLSVVSTCRVLVLFIILPIAIRILRGPHRKAVHKTAGCDEIDLGIIRLAILFDVLSYVGFSTVRTGTLFLVCGTLSAIGGMGSPTLQSALTKHVPPDRTGQVLGAMGLLHAAARVLAPVVFNLIYAETVGKFTQTVFVCLAATWGVAFILSLCIKPNVHWNEKYTEPSDGHTAQPA